MEITLPDGRKAVVIGELGKFTNLFIDGKEVLWPTEKLPKPDKGPEEIKVVIIPAIDRLRELEDEYKLLYTNDGKVFNDYVRLKLQLIYEARKEFKQKWGLEDPLS